MDSSSARQKAAKSQKVLVQREEWWMQHIIAHEEEVILFQRIRNESKRGKAERRKILKKFTKTPQELDVDGTHLVQQTMRQTQRSHRILTQTKSKGTTNFLKR